MNHLVSAELLDQALLELSGKENRIAYNTIPYLLRKEDVSFFKTEDEAREFAISNISEYDSYNVIYSTSTIDFVKQLQYGIDANQIAKDSFPALETPPRAVPAMAGKQKAQRKDAGQLYIHR